MKKKIEVVILKTEKEIGEKGEKKNVALGYARNFLFPKNLAVLYDSKLGKKIFNQYQEKIKEQEKKNQELESLAAKINNFQIKTKKKISKTEIKEKIEKEFKVKIKTTQILGNLKLGYRIEFAPNISSNIKILQEEK